MKRILVIQLCRMGDVLQTTPMLRGLKRTYPGAAVTLVLHDMMANVPVPSSLYDVKLAFPYSKITSGLSSRPEDWRAHADHVYGFLERLGSEPFDLAVNVTHNDISGLLTAIIPAGSVEGAIVAPDRRRLVRGRWMTYFWASQLARVQGCFNLVDLHNWTAGVPSDRQGLEIEVTEPSRAKMSEWLAARNIGSRPLIALQMGASEERKRWPPERFAETINLLPPELGEVVLVGASSERWLVERAQPCFNRQVHDAVGATSIGELAALLTRCRALLTNDTGTMHVASAVGTRIVDVSTGPVFVHETGPYGEGHLVIEPEMDCFPCALGTECYHVGCRDAFTPADIAALVRASLGDGPLPTPARARILRGAFIESGRIDYRCVWPQAPTRAERIRMAAAEMWERSLGVPGGRGGGLPPLTGPERHAAMPGSLETDGELDDMVRALRQLARDTADAHEMAARVTGAAGMHQSQLGVEIGNRLQAMQRSGRLHAICQPIVAFLTVRLNSIAELDVPSVARLYADELSDASRRAGWLADRLLREVADQTCAGCDAMLAS